MVPSNQSVHESPSNGSRIISLDALRQIAALIVLVQHFLGIFQINTPQWMRTGIFDARAAVTLFFVLSGYVLALSLAKDPISLRSYIFFGIRRVLRLYPLHIAATLLALLALIWIKSSGGFSRPLHIPVEFLDEPGFSTRQWLAQLTLILPEMRMNFANPPVWTLMTEARIAILFPFIAWPILRAPRIASVLIVLVLVAGSDWADKNLIGTVALLGQFGLGAAIARYLPNRRLTDNHFFWCSFVTLSLVLYSLESQRYQMPSVWIASYLAALGATGLIISALKWEPLHTKLSGLQSFLRFDISYGLYILHFPIMLLTRKITGETDLSPVGALAIFLVVLFSTVAVSIILLRALELPAIRLGKKITRRAAISPSDSRDDVHRQL